MLMLEQRLPEDKVLVRPSVRYTKFRVSELGSETYRQRIESLPLPPKPVEIP